MPLAHLQEKPLRFRSGEIELEGRIQVPASGPESPQGCVICHPHPLYGGDMDNNVVVAIAAALAAQGVATLRFNFRGVGSSGGSHGDGEGEIGDLRAAVQTFGAAIGSRSVHVAGYSFGSVVALKLAAQRQGDHVSIDGVAAIAPPLAVFDASFVSRMNGKLLFVAGDRDQYCPRDRFEALEAEQLPADTDRSSTGRVLLAGADHFLGGYEERVGKAVADWVRGAD